jgi:hypothetical protein
LGNYQTYLIIKQNRSWDNAQLFYPAYNRAVTNQSRAIMVSLDADKEKDVVS